jgi:DNA primase catalytic core
MLSFMTQCQNWLSQSPEAMTYLTSERFLTSATIANAKIGFFPPKANYVQQDGFPPELERLRGRIVVPVFSEFGKLVGFAGRMPNPSVKGWWNTRFVKSSHLYGFNEARKAVFQNNKAYLFEGYFDGIVLKQSGLGNSVVAMGTNLGLRRIGLLARYCDKICICFDTDQNDAGLLGMFRTLADMYAIGIGMQPSTWELTTIQLPVKVDPDEYVIQNGLDAFLNLEKPIGEDLLKKAEQAYMQLKWRMKDRQNKEMMAEAFSNVTATNEN